MAILYLKYRESQIPILFHIILCISAYLLWFALICIILPFFLIFQLLRLACRSLACFYDTGHPVSLEDIPFVLDYEFNPYIIVGFTKIKGHLERETFIELFRSRIIEPTKDNPLFDKLKKYITCSFSTYVWKSDENFKLETYITQYEEDIDDDELEVKRIFQKLASEQFNPNHAPWKVLICYTVDRKSTYIFSAFHHAVGDGFSLQALMMCLFDSPPKFITPHISHGVMHDMYSRIIHGVFTGPLAVTSLLFSRYFDNPFFVEYTGKRDERCITWAKSPFERVHFIKNHTKTTVNDVLLAALASALTKYFDGKSEMHEIPIVISFNSRSFHERNKEFHALKNSTGGSFISLPINQSAVKSLEIIHRRTKILKNTSDGHTFEFIFSRIIGLLPEYVGKLAAGSLRQHCSLLVSNIPGPLEPVYINNLEVESLISTPPLMYDLGVAIAFFTYSGNIYISVLSVKKVLPDPDILTNLFVQEISNLYAHCKQKIE